MMDKAIIFKKKNLSIIDQTTELPHLKEINKATEKPIKH